mgnify:CR=1 FL=1
MPGAKPEGWGFTDIGDLAVPYVTVAQIQLGLSLGQPRLTDAIQTLPPNL